MTQQREPEQHCWHECCPIEKRRAGKGDDGEIRCYPSEPCKHDTRRSPALQQLDVICPHKIEMTARGDCNYPHSDCPYQILKWDGEMIHKMLCGVPVIRQPKETECFGQAFLETDDMCCLCRASEDCKRVCAHHPPAPQQPAQPFLDGREYEVMAALSVIQNTKERYEDDDNATVEDVLDDVRNHLEGSLIDIDERKKQPPGTGGDGA